MPMDEMMDPNLEGTSQNGKEICIKGNVGEETPNAMADWCTGRLLLHLSDWENDGNFDRNREVAVLNEKIMSTILESWSLKRQQAIWYKSPMNRPELRRET